jgi:hypothetical protein
MQRRSMGQRGINRCRSMMARKLKKRNKGECKGKELKGSNWEREDDKGLEGKMREI